MTTLFREQKDNIVNPALAGKNILPNCETFDRDVFDAILNENGCVKLRIYSGLAPDLTRKSIVVGVNSNDEDILPPSAAMNATEEEVFIGEDSITCPPICPPPSHLNP